MFESGGTDQEALETFVAARFKAYSDALFIQDKLKKVTAGIPNIAAD